MEFRIINLENWDRKEYFHHYSSQIPCTYSMTVKLDITRIIEKKERLYPAMLYGITTIVNRHEEFRTAQNDKGEVGIYSDMIPCYTIFHKDTETFSNLWTEYDPDYQRFRKAYEDDLSQYGEVQGMMAKQGVPDHTFPVSMIPWTSFEGFHLNLQKGYQYFLPIFTIGRYEEREGKYLLPLAIQVHHSVCDGFHVCRFVNELQELLKNW